MKLIGSLRCLATPAETGARGLIVVSVVTEVLSVLLFLGLEMGLAWQLAQPLASTAAIRFVQPLLGITALVTFILFLRKLALFLGRPDLVRHAVDLLILTGLLIGIYLAVDVVLPIVLWNNAAPGLPRAGLGPMAELIFVAGVTMLVLLCVALIKYVNLLGAMRSAILGPQ